MRAILLFITLFFLLEQSCVKGQEINFGEYGSYTITLDLNMDDLVFGEVVNNSGIHEMDIPDAIRVEIHGVKYLDVFVEITVENGGLLLDGVDPENRIPFYLKAAYSNIGADNNNTGSSVDIPVAGNMANARFPILKQRFEPPGPPPPPPTGAFNQSQIEETAILYLYGSLDVGDVAPGNYTGEITINVSYE